MVQSYSNHPPGTQRRAKDFMCSEQSETDDENNLLPLLYRAGLDRYRAVTVLTEDGSGKVFTRTWRNEVNELNDSKPAAMYPGQLDQVTGEIEIASTTNSDACQALPGPAHTANEARKTTVPDASMVQETTTTTTTNLSVGRLASHPTSRLGRSHARRRDSQLNGTPSYGVVTVKPEMNFDEPPRKRPILMQSFRIGDEDKVTEFLCDRLRIMLQIPDKTIAKAWIKGICPKKQALFPYQNNNRKNKFGLPPEIPGWWPPLEQCPFIEPDHIKKDHRQNLVMHLLRLRPTPEQLTAWNHGKVDATHVHGQWTVFLKSLTPESIFNDCKENTGVKKQQRWKHLMDLYDVAEMEEEYRCLGMGGDQLFQWTNPPNEPRSRKTQKRKSVAATFESDADSETRSTSMNRGQMYRKKRRQPSSSGASLADGKLSLNMARFAIADNVVPDTMNLDQQARTEADETFRRSKHQVVWRNPAWTSSTVDEKSSPEEHNGMASHWSPTDMWAPAQQNYVGDPCQCPVVEQHHASPWSSCEVSPAHSFDNSTSSQVGAFDAYSTNDGFSVYPGQQKLTFPPYSDPSVQPFQIHQASQMASPQFDTVPNTPIYSPMTLAPANVHMMPNVMPAATGTIPAQDFPFLSAYEGQPMAPSAQTMSHGLPMYYAGGMSTMQQQNVPFIYDERHIDPAFEAAQWNQRGFTGHSSGVGGGQPT